MAINVYIQLDSTKAFGPGPYNIYYRDLNNNLVFIEGPLTTSELIAGQNYSIPNNVQVISLKSINPACNGFIKDVAISSFPSPTPTPTVTPSITITPTITPSITITPTPTPSHTPTQTITPTVTTTQTNTPSYTPTTTPTITVTSTVSPTITPSPTTTPVLSYHLKGQNTYSTSGTCCGDVLTSTNYYTYINQANSIPVVGVTVYATQVSGVLYNPVNAGNNWTLLEFGGNLYAVQINNLGQITSYSFCSSNTTPTPTVTTTSTPTPTHT